MKNAVSFIFAALLGVVGLSACGGGGGAAAPNIQPPMATPVPTGGTARPLNASEMQELSAKVSINYAALHVDNDEFDNYLLGLPELALKLSQNDYQNPSLASAEDGLFTTPTYNIIVVNQTAGFTRAVETRINGVLTDLHTVVVVQQRGTKYLAVLCADPPFQAVDFGTGLCAISHWTPMAFHCDDPQHTFHHVSICSSPAWSQAYFTLPRGTYNATDVFLFRRGLIGNAHAFGNWHVNAENKHAEYRWTPFSDVFIDGGFWRLGNADMTYAKMQMDYKNFYLQYTLGNLRSDYYQSGKIDGVAFGWQKDGFAAKAEKPIGNADKAWFRLFYKTDL